MKKSVVVIMVVVVILLLLSMIPASASSLRDYGINTEFDAMYRTWTPYQLTVSILFGTCEGAEIWIEIPEETEVRLFEHSYDKVGYVEALEKEPGVFIGEFW